jgi:hypothetical protein
MKSRSVIIVLNDLTPGVMNCYLKYSWIGLSMGVVLVKNVALAGEQLMPSDITVYPSP